MRRRAGMAATGMEAGAAAGGGAPLSGLESGSGTVGAGVIPTRTPRGLITTRFLRSRIAAGRAFGFGATDTGRTERRGAAGKKKPAGKAGFFHLILLLLPLAHVDEMSGNRRRGSHCRRHEMRAALVTLASFEIAVRRRSATLTREQFVWVHRKAHRTTRFAPLEAGSLEDLVEPFRLRLHFHEAGAGDDHRVDIAIDGLAIDNASCRAQILDASVGA